MFFSLKNGKGESIWLAIDLMWVAEAWWEMTLLSTLSRPITAEPAPPPAPQSQLTRTDSAPLLLTPLLCPPPPKSSDCDYCLVPIGFFFSPPMLPVPVCLPSPFWPTSLCFEPLLQWLACRRPCLDRTRSSGRLDWTAWLWRSRRHVSGTTGSEGGNWKRNHLECSPVVALGSLLKFITGDDLLPRSGGCVYLTIGPIWFQGKHENSWSHWMIIKKKKVSKITGLKISIYKDLQLFLALSENSNKISWSWVTVSHVLNLLPGRIFTFHTGADICRTALGIIISAHG